MPIAAYSGSDDPNVRPEHMDAWREETSVGFDQRVFPGGHFYLLRDSRSEFLRCLRDDLAPWLR